MNKEKKKGVKINLLAPLKENYFSGIAKKLRKAAKIAGKIHSFFKKHFGDGRNKGNINNSLGTENSPETKETDSKKENDL